MGIYGEVGRGACALGVTHNYIRGPSPLRAGFLLPLITKKSPRRDESLFSDTKEHLLRLYAGMFICGPYDLEHDAKEERNLFFEKPDLSKRILAKMEVLERFAAGRRDRIG